MINPVSIRIDLQPQLIYIPNLEKSIEQINQTLREYLENFTSEFSFCFKYKRKKIIDNSAYFYNPFLIINTFELDNFIANIFNFRLICCDIVLQTHHVQLVKIKPSLRGYVFFSDNSLRNEFESILKDDFMFYVFEDYRKRLIQFYENKYKRKLRNNSLMFKVKKTKNSLAFELWGSRKMILLFNTLGLIDSNLRSIAFFYPVHDTK